ncbi:MAG: 3-hydroxybutyryl-CoA dehydrogenase [Balneolaceae bacterium]|nr:MAG: 3-hydroxybutyryl-CoA dehydrogenase [Balneolaceae bacterium]
MKQGTFENVGIVGAGTMGTGIAQVASTFRHTVYIYDPYPDQFIKSRNSIEKILSHQISKGRITPDERDGILNRIHFVSHIKDFSTCEIVFEAILEDVKAKKDQLSRIEGIVSKNCILATNTSSLSISSLSSALKKPGRFLGIHFFNPAAVMKLVEIIPSVSTAPETVSRAKKILDSWQKIPVLAKDTPGFIVNRVARPFYGEALRIYEEGIADAATIDWAMKEMGGFKMGPFELMDMIGNDVNYTVTETVFRDFYFDPRFKPSFVQKRMVEAGWLGKKTGRGFYDYRKGAVMPEPNRDRNLGEKIFNRILTMLINEAADAVLMHIATKEEVDLAMKYGVNYPKGLLEWANEIGLEIILAHLEQLQNEYGEYRYRPNPLLKRKVASGEKFF